MTKKEQEEVEFFIDADLQKKLLDMAKKENISLDQLVNRLLRKKIIKDRKEKFIEGLKD